MNIPDFTESSNDYKNIHDQKQFIRRYISKDVQSNDGGLVKVFVICFCWRPILYLFLCVFFHPIVTVGSPVHHRAVTWRWGPASCQISNHLKVECFPTKSHLIHKNSLCSSMLMKCLHFLTLCVTNIISVWFLLRLCVWGDWWLAAGHWWLAEVFLSSGSGPWLFGCQECEWFCHWKDLNVQAYEIKHVMAAAAVFSLESSCYPDNQNHH